MHGGQLAASARPMATIRGSINAAQNAADRFSKIRAQFSDLVDQVDGQKNAAVVGVSPPTPVPNGQAEELEAVIGQLHSHASFIESLIERLGARL